MPIAKKITAVISAAAVGLGLNACGTSAASDGEDTITLGYLPTYTDTLSMAYLLDDQFEKLGYEVEHQTLNEPAALYEGLANGDVDVFTSGWPEQTHAPYWNEHQDVLEDLGVYNANANNHLSVPEYVEDVNSIEDLAGQGERFGGTIYGIEPGAGLTIATEEDVMPGYGLDGEYELKTSSTPAMLAELQTAIDNQEDIVVTLWTPYWANNEFPVKALEDPEGHYGEPEGMHFLGRPGFAEDFPEATEWLGQVQLTDEQYADLENLIVNEYEEGEEDQAVDEWLEQYPDVLPALPEQAAESAA